MGTRIQISGSFKKGKLREGPEKRKLCLETFSTSGEYDSWAKQNVKSDQKQKPGRKEKFNDQMIHSFSNMRFPGIKNFGCAMCGDKKIRSITCQKCGRLYHKT